MIFLPIVGRELRVAARKRSTFWVRIVSASIALLLGIGFLTIVLSMPRGIMGTSAMGKGLFAVLSWLALIGVLFAGVFSTSDCVSEEKREGTLGFLFLTDLRGYDVTSGKLLAQSLRAFYCLLAIFPVLAITLLLGGVTGSQFGLTCLALTDALLFSLAAGLLVSTVGNDPQKVMSGTILILLLTVIGAPVLDGCIAHLQGTGFSPLCSLASPGYLFTSASMTRFSHYWAALAVTGSLIAIMFILATFLVTRTWQVRAGRKTKSEANTWLYAAKYGGSRFRGRMRSRLLDRNPVMWLASRERWQAMAIWALAFVGAAMAVWTYGEKPHARIAWGYGGLLLSAVVWFWAASQSCRFFFEARKSGLVELLLVGPLDERKIVQGHWRALSRRFALPVIILVCVQVTAAFFRQAAFRSMAVASGQQALLAQAALIAGVISSGVTFIGNLIAIGWVGMWFGLTSRSANSATLKTLLFVQVIPWFVGSFSGVMAVPLLLFSQNGQRSANWAQFWPYITIFTTGLLYLVKNIAFIAWARNNLYSRFRIEATRSYSVLKPAVVPAPLHAAPPVLAR